MPCFRRHSIKFGILVLIGILGRRKMRSCFLTYLLLLRTQIWERWQEKHPHSNKSDGRAVLIDRSVFMCCEKNKKGIDESEKGGILIEVKYGAMAKW